MNSTHNLLLRLKKEMLLNYSYTATLPLHSLGWQKREILRDLLHYEIYGVHPRPKDTFYVLQNGVYVSAKGFKLAHPHQKILYAVTTHINLKCALRMYKSNHERGSEKFEITKDPRMKTEYFIFNKENPEDLTISENFDNEGYLLKSSVLKTDIENALFFHKLWGTEENESIERHPNE